MKIHEIKSNNKSKSQKRVGRGGIRGKTSGRGHKGQKARAGRKLRPQIRDIMKALPKLRGHSDKNSNQEKVVGVNLSTLDKLCKSGDKVNKEFLFEKGLLKKGGKLRVKILGMGEISKKITVSGFKTSTSAKEKIEKAGGKIE